MDFNFDNIFRIEDILINFLPFELVLYTSTFYLYPHQILEKPRVLLNYILQKELPILRAHFKDMNPKNFRFLIFYKLKNHLINNISDFFGKKYNKKIHKNNLVHFNYYLQRFNKYIMIEEVTNCKIDDYEEYVRNTYDFKIKKDLYKLI